MAKGAPTKQRISGTLGRNLPIAAPGKQRISGSYGTIGHQGPSSSMRPINPNHPVKRVSGGYATIGHQGLSSSIIEPKNTPNSSKPMPPLPPTQETNNVSKQNPMMSTQQPKLVSGNLAPLSKQGTALNSPKNSPVVPRLTPAKQSNAPPPSSQSPMQVRKLPPRRPPTPEEAAAAAAAVRSRISTLPSKADQNEPTSKSASTWVKSQTPGTTKCPPTLNAHTMASGIQSQTSGDVKSTPTLKAPATTPEFRSSPPSASGGPTSPKAPATTPGIQSSPSFTKLEVINETQQQQPSPKSDQAPVKLSPG
jgi:hypothetical protein